MFMNNRAPNLDELLGTSIAAFDIPDDVYARAVGRYTELADWLASAWRIDSSGGLIYPQGSIRLGTMVTPIDPKAEYDIDLVCRRDILKESITQRELKLAVGDALDGYIDSGPDGNPRKEEGARCWTLQYPREPFHMDVLPTVPNLEAAPNGVWLTDRDLRNWQPSNPVDFADWFHAVMARETIALREALAKQMDVEQAPPSTMKTTLQRIAQALKRHRDIYFSGKQEARPASVIITTLAATAYSGGGTLYEVLVDVTRKMPGLVQTRDHGRFWIPNPVQPDENFADRWNRKPGGAEAFFRWIDAARADFESLGDELGIDQVVQKMARSFGRGPTEQAGSRVGQRLAREREGGRLGVTSTGLLAPAAGRRAIPQHTFHGDATAPPRA